VALSCQDALNLPNADDQFEAVFMSFALELFDSPEIPQLLGQVKRVLKPNGRLGVVSMAKEDGASPMLKIYEWLHQVLPQVVDCRPIYVEQSIREAGFAIQYQQRFGMFGLPVEIAVGMK
jgi:demethylmenaquinone methyltransferase/2-methoxy-6-polyprenyl-1,4-benzoquinol methylase